MKYRRSKIAVAEDFRIYPARGEAYSILINSPLIEDTTLVLYVTKDQLNEIDKDKYND
tara:strand:+ start:3343 stop:3516 length:174 start_codon:yes stop_codon:yes gene_type:complete